MRIPVSHADLESGRFTKISRALRKLWPLRPLSLVQAQNTMATLLGYRNLHDLQGSLVIIDRHTVSKRFSRSDIRNAVTWMMFRRHGIEISQGSEIANKLHLNTLDFDATTSDAEELRRAAEAAEQGILLDEFGYQWGNRKDSKTPTLLQSKKLPPFEFAVFPDRQVFRWRMLVDLLEQLPIDFLDDLRNEPKYAGLSDQQIEISFAEDELFPQVREPLSDAVRHKRQYQVIPRGFEIMWIFDKDRKCLGRVLHNKDLCGLIPVLYGIDDDGIYSAIEDLLCGKTIPATVSRMKVGDNELFTLQQSGGGYDLRSDIWATRALAGDFPKVPSASPEFPSELPPTVQLRPLPSHIRLERQGRKYIFAGSNFMEGTSWAKQKYLRCELPWLQSKDLIPGLCLASELDRWEEAQTGSNDELRAVPPSSTYLYDLMKERISKRFSSARARAGCLQGLSALAYIFLQTIDVAAFEAHCAQSLDESLGYADERYGDANGDREHRIREIELAGEQIQKMVPVLRSLKPSSLGLANLLMYGEYPGSRHEYSVVRPAERDFDLPAFMAGLLLAGLSTNAADSFPEDGYSKDVLVFVADQLIRGQIAPAKMRESCESASLFLNRMREHEKAVKTAEEWILAERGMKEMRDTGRYLYVGAQVHPPGPGFTELAQGARSSGIVQVSTEQDTSRISAK